MISDVLGKLVTVKMFFNHVKQSNKVPQKSPDLQNVTDFSVTPPQFKLDDNMKLPFTKLLLCSPSTLFLHSYQLNTDHPLNDACYKHIKVECHVHHCSLTKCLISMKITEEQFVHIHSKLLLVYVFLRVHRFIYSNSQLKLV